MRKASKILALILSVILCMSVLAVSVMAEEAESDGLKLTLTTDKAEYAADEPILVTLKAENISENALNNVALKVKAPAALVASGKATKQLDTLNAGASETLEVTYKLSDSPNTGDYSMVIACVMVLAVGAIVALMAINHKTRCIAMALVMVFGIAAMGMPASAAESYGLEVTTTVKIDGQDMTLKATASWGDVPAEVHVCENVCPDCGKCKNEACTEAACAAKCDCPNVIYSQDFTAQPTDDLGNYVSVENGVELGDDNVLSSTEIRMTRRVLRDFYFRDTLPGRTVMMWSNVCRGEELYIKPFKAESDVAINSFHAYEVGVMASQMINACAFVPVDVDIYDAVQDLRIKLTKFTAIDNALVPKTSLLKEFIR
jgi:hypothetical protein